MEIAYSILFGILGLCIGSFLNVVIYRVPNNISLIKPDSHCPQCKTKIKPYDNIPVLSYILLGGKCRHCKCKIPFRYTLVELLTGILWVLAYLKFQNNITYAVIVCLIISTLIAVSFIDIETQIIYDRFHIILAILAIFTAIYNTELTLVEHIWGLVVGGGMFLLIYLFYIVILKREGLGFGDVKLMAVCGFILGIKSTVFAIFLSSLIAAIVLGLITVVKSKDKTTEFPFAPFLSLGIIIAILYGLQIVNAYLALL